MCPDIARMILVLLKLFPSDENWLVMVLEHERLTAEIMEIIFREINFRMMQFDSLTLPQCISKLIPQEKCRQLELDAEHNPHSVLEKFEFYPQSCRLKAAYHLSLDGNDNNNLATLCNNLCIRPDGCYEISQLNLYDKFYELRNARIRSFIDLFARREDEVLAYIRKNTEIKETLLKIPELWPASWIEAAHFRPSTSLTDQRGGDSSPDEELRGEEFERAAKRPRLEPETEN